MTDEKTERWRQTAHLNFGKDGGGYEWTSINRPRVSAITRSNGSMPKYYVDGVEVADVVAIDVALATPPVLTLLELEMLRTLTEDWQSLHQMTGIRKLQDEGHSGGYSPGMPKTECLHAYMALKKKGLTLNDAGKVMLRPGPLSYTVEE